MPDSQDNILGGDAETLTLAPVACGSGYAADFSVSLSSGSSGGSSGGSSRGSSGSSADTTVSAALRSARVVRLKSGRCQVRIRLKPAETVTLATRVTRNGHRLANRRVSLASGSRLIRINLGSSVRAGAARLTLRLKDSSGNSKTFHRSLHIPKRRR